LDHAARLNVRWGLRTRHLGMQDNAFELLEMRDGGAVRIRPAPGGGVWDECVFGRQPDEAFLKLF
jgi:hypothetical protein